MSTLELAVVALMLTNSNYFTDYQQLYDRAIAESGIPLNETLIFDASSFEVRRGYFSDWNNSRV